MKVLFVCLGNICRSPTAEGIFRNLVRESGLHHQIQVDSRGTGGWHVAEPPDPRSQETALEFGVDISDLRGAQFSTYDFEQYDLILVMDEGNHRDVLRLARDEEDRKKVDFLLSYSKVPKSRNVPDPYHGGPEGFRQVYKLIEEACHNLLHSLKR